jgi:hypothetical protein
MASHYFRHAAEPAISLKSIHPDFRPEVNSRSFLGLFFSSRLSKYRSQQSHSTLPLHFNRKAGADFRSKKVVRKQWLF